MYDTAVLLSINSGLFVYSVAKLVQSIKKKKASENANNHHRFSFFFLFSLAVFSRVVNEVHLVYDKLAEKVPSDAEKNFFKILDCLPTLLFLTICCLFAHFWHKVYIRFEQDEEAQAKQINLRLWLVVYNVILYVVSVYILIINFSDTPDHVDLLMNAVFTISTMCMTILLSVTGKRFHDRTVKWLKYMGKTVKSTKGFQTMFIMLIVCLIITCCRQFTILLCRLIFNMTPSNWIRRNFLTQTSFLIAHISYLAIIFFVGEFLPWLLLVRLLDSAAKKSTVNRTPEPDYRLNYSLSSMQSSTSSSLL